MIREKSLEPSREDAIHATRQEKMSIICLSYAATVLDDLKDEIPDRIKMIENGELRRQWLSNELDQFLNDIRLTVPMNQRLNMQNTAKDYEMRLAPKATPYYSNVIMQTEEFRELVDAARIKCRECTEDDVSCEKCRLYQLLTSLLPMEDYHVLTLCPYNLGEWRN